VLAAGAGNAYYEGGNDHSEVHRATTIDRNGGRVNLCWWTAMQRH